MISSVALLLFPAGMALAASSDLLTMKISNRLVLLLVAAFFLVALLVQLPLPVLGMQLLCAMLVLAVGFTFFAMGWIGGGDAKLAAAIALWLGFDMATPFLVYASLLGGVLTLSVLGLRNLPLMPVLTRFGWLERLYDPKSGVPYGVALAIAGLLTYSGSTIFERLAA
ncbi:MAG: A24 family peptidase [Devosia sp.]